MPISAEQREQRRGFLGSSDAPAIAGVDPWSSPFAVYMQKVFDVDELPNVGPIARGNRYESVLLDWAQEQLGVEIERNVSVRHADGICAANLDGRVKGKKIGVEAKVTGLAEQFGDPGTDDIPERIIVQTHHQMYVDDLEMVWVPVLLARYGRPEEQMFRVDRNEELIESIVARNHAFWTEYVLPKLPPPLGEAACLDVLKRIRRQPGSIASVPESLIEAWELAKAQKGRAVDAEELAKSAVIGALGDAEAGDFGDPHLWLTYFEQSRAGYTVKPTSFRVARIVKR